VIGRLAPRDGSGYLIGAGPVGSIAGVGGLALALGLLLVLPFSLPPGQCPECDGPLPWRGTCPRCAAQRRGPDRWATHAPPDS
jgi:hypothetical protein